jgi:hypothetical protein
MIVAAIMLATQSAAPYMAKPFFGFACHPANPAAVSPTFEYRIFLPSSNIPASGPAKAEITKLQGFAGAPDHLTLEGTLDRVQAPPFPNQKFDLRMGRLKAMSEQGGHSYTLDMWFGLKFAHDPSGQSTFAGIVPSTGTLRSDLGPTTLVQLTCPDLTGRAAPTERGS